MPHLYSECLLEAHGPGCLEQAWGIAGARGRRRSSLSRRRPRDASQRMPGLRPTEPVPESIGGWLMVPSSPQVRVGG